MHNRKAEKRGRKLKEREREKRQYQQAQRIRARFPEILIENSGADPEFIDVIRRAVRAFSFSELPAGQQTAFRQMKQNGAHTTLETLQAAMECVRAEDPSNRHGQIADLEWLLTLGELGFVSNV